MKTAKRHKMNFWVTIALLLISTSIYAAVEYAPDEILVKFKAETKKEEAKSSNNLRWKLNAKEVKKFVINNVYQMELLSNISVEQAILEAYKNPNVQYAEPNYIVHANKIPNDPMYNQLWGMEKIQAPQAWDNTTGSNQIIVAVIDSGVDYTHPDIASQYIGGYDFHNNDSDPMDDNGHGTHCAGTIGAVGNNNIGVVGVCWNIKIMALKFLDASGSGYLSNALSAIEYAANHGAKILSNSWGGGGYSQAMKDAITNAGCLFIAAAGNDAVNNDTNPHYPSSYDNPNIIAVAATDQNDNLASFSCYGPNSVDLAAPGVSILSTVPGNQYKSYQGTSMATPHVSGVCGLIWSQNPSWTYAQVKDKLLQSVDKISSLQGKVLTGGRLNAYKATQGGGTPPPEPPTPPPTPEPPPTPPGGNVIFYDDMEKGTNGWSTIGFDCLWHRTHLRYTSSNTSWYYGFEETNNYDTGWINFGSLISPTISLKNISGTECALTFNYWREVEYYTDMYDVTTVMISPDGGWTWNILWWMDSSNPSTSKWEQETISLNDYIGKDIILAFIFNTIDYSDNDYEGWYIDDVTITTDGGTEPPPPEKQPNIEIEPSSIPNVQVTKDGTTAQTIKIKNTGEADLTYSITNKNTTSAEIYRYEPGLEKESQDETLNIDNVQWQIIWNKKTGAAHRVYGGSMTLSGLNERDFITQHYDLLKVNEKDLKLERDEIHNHQRYITFQQMYNDIPVYNAKVELRYDIKTYQLIMFGSDAYPDINISTTPNITAEEAQKATKETGEIRSTRLIVFPTDEQNFLAYEVIVFTENPPHLWIYIINAQDSSIITKWDAIKYGEITGTVKGKVHSFYPTDGQIQDGFANEKINISGANSGYTNKNGYYSAAVSDTNSHTVTTSLTGSYVSITNKQGQNAGYTGSAKSGTPCNIQWDDSNSNITERDVYYHVQLAHSKIKEIDPDFNGVDYCAPADVNYPNLSNAYFEGYGYCFGDGKDPQCPFNQNLGQVADVVFHEYGHGIMHFQYNQDWDNSLEFTSMHEGMADYFSSTITNEPLIGEGINGINYVMRNIDVPDATPSSTEPECHDRGKVIAGALWDLRKGLGAELTDHLFHFARYGHAKTFTDYYIDLLLEDDNDGNYNNGTPHSQEIYSAFALHDIANVNPQDPNDNTAPAKTSDLTAATPTYNKITLQWTAPGDDGTTGQAHSYDIRYSTAQITDANWNQANQLLGEPYPKKVGSQETVTVSGLESDTTYYFALKTRDNKGNWSNLSNIANAKTQTGVTVYSNDMETDITGWTTDCTWQVINTGGHSGARCWTDTPNGNYSNNTNCSLISPSFDLTNSANTTLNLWHKYNLEKDYDLSYIEISTNNGTAWEIVKTYTGENTSWTNTTVDLSAYDGQKDVKIRFRLHSNYTGAYDGWYIDDIKIFASGNAATPKWLTFNPVSGTIPASSEQTITLNYDAKALKVGDYETNVTITSNDPDTPELQLIAKMTVTDNTPPPSLPNITITQPANGAKINTKQINVSGTIDDNNATVKINGISATISNNTFTAAITLTEGQNTITAIATNSGGSTTITITVTLDTTPPVITITSPEDGSIVSSKTINVEGSVNELDATVTVNGSQVTLSNGSFSKTITLNKGLNTITITAVDPLKNTSAKTIKVTYAPGPKIQISPSTLPSVTLSAGQSTTQNFTISNVGDSDLVFSIGLSERSSQNLSLRGEYPLSLRGEDPLSLRAEGEAISYTNAEIPPTPDISDHHPHRLLVKFKEGVAERSSAFINSSLGAQIIKTYNAIGVQKVEIPSNIELKEAIATYMDSGNVDYAEPDFAVHALVTPNDPQFSSLWGLHNTGQNGGANDADIDAPEAWDITKGSPNIIIAVIDTGVDYNHEDLAGNMWTGPNGEHGYDFYNGDGDPMDDNGHGSHCSGTIAGIGNNGRGVVGVNWTARIMAVKFLSGDGAGYTSDAIDGIIYAVNNGARILSNSWGGGDYSQALKDAIEYANSHNVLFVAAAGNDGTNNDYDPHYPSSFDCANIIAVAALDKNDNMASFSCYGLESVDIGAPGVSILSTTPGNTYSTYSGTSMATPHVSGVAGLVLAQNISLTDEEVKSKILNGAVQIPALTGKCITGGRLNAYNSLEIENDTTPPSPITNLSVSSVTFQSVTLTWTSTGDDGNSGTATSYDLRYSTNPIIQDNFEDATQAQGTPTPKPAGSAEICTISGLSETTQYYFAIKAIDESENKSSISNVLSAITVKSITIFTDNMENGSSKWEAQSPWGLVTNSYKSATHSWHDSPNGNYNDNVTTKLTTIPIDLSIYTSAKLSFWHKYDLETNYDFAYALASIDNGSNWSLLKTYTGHQNNWTNESIDLTSFCGIGKTNVKIQFLLVTDYSITYDGWYIDDLAITGSNNPLWLSINTTQGTIGAGQSKTITLSYNANLVPELYTAEIEINNNSVNDTSISLTAQLKVNPPANAGKNAVTVTASSEYSSAYRATNILDGIIGAWDQGEWASQGSWDRNPWIKISWNDPQTVNTIVIYGRPNKYDKIENARLTLSTGYSTAIGEIPIGGASKIIQIPTSQITWLKIDVLETSAMNPGLTEIELYNVPRYQNKTNLALSANAVASSEYSSSYGASKAVDGIIGQWDQGEWASQGSWDRNPSLKLSWNSPQMVNKLVIYGRPNKFDSIQNAKITLSNGYSITLGEIPVGGAGKEIYFPTAYITWLEFKVLETNALNPGLTEIEAYYEPVTTTNTNIAKQAQASASSEYSSGYRASNTIDGIVGAWDQGEWAAQGSWDRNPWLKLSWNSPQTVNKIIIYGRPNKYDGIQNAKITLSNGYSITLGEIPSGGAKKEISFPTAQITWLEFQVLETTALNPGLTEIEVYYVQTGSTSLRATERSEAQEQTSLRATERNEAIFLNSLLTALDTDNDGIYDKFDAFPEDPTEWEDTDGDGMGNNMDYDDDDDGILDEDDAYPLDIRKSTQKNTPPILITSEGVAKQSFASVDAIFLTIPENAKKEDIKLFVETAHKQKTLVLPIISDTKIESIIDTVIENDYDGAVIDETKLSFVENTSAGLHNKGKQLIVSVTYTENLDLYDIAIYIDRLILSVPENDSYNIETAISEIKLQVPEEKIILETPSDFD